MAPKNTRPDYPTMVAGRLEDGRLIGVDNSVWLYRKVPLAPVAEAKSTDRALAAAAPVLAAYEGLAGMTTVPTDRRGLSRGSYRDTHLLLVNIPTKYRPHHGPLEPYLADQFDDAVVFSRLLLFGVRLDSSIGTGGWKSAVDSVVETFVQGGTPMSDYDKDYKDVDSVLRNAGLAPMTHQDRALADAWWNHGSFPDTPTLFHSDHLHIFTSAEAANVVEEIGPADCSTWPELSGTHSLTFASVQDLELPYVDAGSSAAQWVVPFLQQDAAAVSIRAAVEPAKITRAELRRQRKQYTDDLNERQAQGKMDRAEHEEKMQELAEVEGVYASGGGPATLVDASVLVAFDGQIEDINELSTLQVTLNTMMFRQQQAWAETMLCSNVRANPYKHDLPSTTVAYSGVPSLSTVGDADGVLVGFTESDRQPALLSPTAVSQEDRTPLCVVAAASGAGKTMMMLWIARQLAEVHRPTVIIDPKLGSDLGDAVRNAGGQIVSLDDLMSADGVMDPLRFAMSPQDGIETAASMLLSVNPFGTRKLEFEVPLMSSLNFGVQQGATCIGQALNIALQAGVAPYDMVKAVADLAGASPQFRAMVGVNPASQALSIHDGITLIKVGKTHLNLPTPGTTNDQADLSQRVSLALLRMMIFGSATALTGRDGVILQDEAWTILGSEPKEVERLGRLARSQRVLPILFSQDISGAQKAGLAQFISRGFVGPITDPVEAKAAMELFNIEVTPERLERVTASATMDSFGRSEFAAPNWNSMKALRDPQTREVLRGSVWMYSDLSGRVIPIEVTLPSAFLKLASTSAADQDARKREAEEEAQRQAQLAAMQQFASMGVPA